VKEGDGISVICGKVTQNCVRACACVCVCVCKRERERERASMKAQEREMKVSLSSWESEKVRKFC